MKRTLTSIGYIVVIAALVALKWLVPQGYGSIGFDVLFTVMAAVGAFEFQRAAGGLHRAQSAITYVYCALSVPVYAVLSYLAEAGVIASFIPLFVSLCLFGACFLADALVLVFDFVNADMGKTAVSFMAMLYCGLLPLALSGINHIGENSLFAVIFLFVEVMLTDSFAYIFGAMLHGKFPAKMSPNVSPNKTVVGGMGGVVGALVGGALCWLIFDFWAGLLVFPSSFPSVAMILIVSLCLGVLIQLGDLFESALKRKCGIKDMGNLLPGHGGMLDRFDSMLFNGPIVLFVFFILTLI